MSNTDPAHWTPYKGDSIPYTEDQPITLPSAPSWRQFQTTSQEMQALKGEHFLAPPVAVEMVNAALTLRRPLLVTGNPGTGKSTLAYAVARELRLGSVLKWAITTRITLNNGLYNYDAIGRLQDAQISGQKDLTNTGNYITLGPLGTAFVPRDLPRVLLIDEIDKSDIDLPNDLLNLFEDGEFPIPELQRLDLENPEVRTLDRGEGGKQQMVPVPNGVVRCKAFPLVIMTSNGERDFPPPFLRRCLRFRMPNPTEPDLKRIIDYHLGQGTSTDASQIMRKFLEKIEANETIATDQLLNVIHLRTQERTVDWERELSELEKRLLKDLGSEEIV